MVFEGSKDWRSFCSPIRDQGNCGSCTAFGTIGAWEPAMRITFAKDMDLSERDLFFCSGGFCDLGNMMEPVLTTAVGGIASEADCPYIPVDCACGSGKATDWTTRGAKLTSWKGVTDPAEMKTLLDKTPLVGVMDVHESFLHYQGGVYHSLGAEDPVVGGHCIAIVGYDEAKGAWLLRNSWGLDWGEAGYGWIQYGDSAIDQIMYSLEICVDPPAPPPPPEPACKYARAVSKVPVIGWPLVRGYRKVRKALFGIEPGNP